MADFQSGARATNSGRKMGAIERDIYASQQIVPQRGLPPVTHAKPIQSAHTLAALRILGL